MVKVPNSHSHGALRAPCLAGVLLVGVLLVGACASSNAAQPEPVGVSTRPESPGVSFVFDSLDDREVSIRALRGKPTVLAFGTTWDLMSQAQVRYLMAMSEHDGEKVNYVMVALEGRSSRELVELYRQRLKIGFRVALADMRSVNGIQGFEDIRQVPHTIVLDSAGRIVFSHPGLAKSDEIRKALRGLN